MRLHRKGHLDLSMALLDVTGEVVGSVEEEVEHVWYGMIPQDGQLGELVKQAFVTRHLQEQCQGVLAFDRDQPKVRTVLRVRRVNREKSVLTRKTRTDDMPGCLEKSTEILDSEFKFYTEVFGTGIAKMRHTIDVMAFEGKLELDIFLDKHGHPTGAAKYDWEVKKSAKGAPLPPLPITLINQVYFDPFNPTDEGIANLRNFMQAQSFRYD